MSKYVLELLEMNNNNAGTKAKKDISRILKNIGYNEIYLDPDMNRIEKLIFAPNLIKRKISSMESGSEFVFQYPLYSKRFSTLFLKKLFKRTDITKKVVIHDLESLRRYKDDSNYVQKEINVLNKFDVIISHNTSMSNWLIDNGIKQKKIVNLELFDYLNPNEPVVANRNDSIVYAGNLKKAAFLSDLPDSLSIKLFGINPPKIMSNGTHYEGVYSPEELPKHLSGSYGLVWDGTSIDECNGITGEYLRYNNPHKASLYLSCGLPIIVWNQSAISKFVISHNLGIAVNSLANLDDVLNGISDENYRTMQNNVLDLVPQLRKGEFTKKAISKL